MNQSAENLCVHQNDPMEMARQLAAKWLATAVEPDRAGGSVTAERQDMRDSGLLFLQIPKEYRERDGISLYPPIFRGEYDGFVSQNRKWSLFAPVAGVQSIDSSRKR